jgi:dolichol-phosphate mannosyltransferase
VAYLTLMTALRALGIASLGDAQLISSLIVIGLNFLLNNQFTFRSLRLRGRRFVAGLLIFYIACSVGVLLNLRTFDYLRISGAPWYIAAVAGVFAGSLWNYWISSVMIWQVRRRRRQSAALAGSR